MLSALNQQETNSGNPDLLLFEIKKSWMKTDIFAFFQSD